MLRIKNYAIGFLVFSAAVSAQTGTLKVVSTQDLGTLGGDYSTATGINAAGQVAGTSRTASGEVHGFLWQARTGMVDLGTLPPGPRPPSSGANGINGNGQIVGQSACGLNCTHAVIWDPRTGMNDRGDLGPVNQALAINDAGQFGGMANTVPGCRTCFNWAFVAPVGGGDFRFLGSPYGGFHSAVYALNNLGQAAGATEIDGDITFFNHAFFWSDRTGMIDLGTFGGNQSEAHGINNRGQVVGWSHAGRVGSDTQHAFLWQAGPGMTDLGGLEPFYQGQALAINDDGLIAGWSTIDAARHAVVWQPGVGARDLGTTENGGNSEAHALNMNLQVVGQAILANGETHAILWTLAVNHENHPPVAACGSPRSGGVIYGSEGTPAGMDALASSDPDGDTLDFRWSFGDGTSDHTGAVGFTSHTYADNGTYVVQVTVTDPSGLSSSAQCQVQVSNVPPSFPCGPARGCTDPIPGGAILQGETFLAPWNFLDPGADTWTATVNYGDGSGPMPLPLSGKNFTLSHRYRTPGTFPVMVTVTDDDAGVGSAQNNVVVKSWQQAIGEVEGAVSALGAAGVLDGGEVNALLQKLEAAIKQLDAGMTMPAGNQLGAFLNQIGAMVQAGQLTAPAGQLLTDAVNRVLAAMQG